MSYIRGIETGRVGSGVPVTYATNVTRNLWQKAEKSLPVSQLFQELFSWKIQNSSFLHCADTAVTLCFIDRLNMYL